ncbi:Oxysterol-binding protein-domain-containing protein [Fomitopsis serialis]|uniref:Oxysterol-binding protein-domain-containing protein n=1 Tax=Fomitopsis serialis TaxID=139415 RepID=UPI002007395C|nr:Oxysterol-binding protein-domain-containing protein [Neoantrodia serialis]KAH9937519.1 Oxysterol-binding protein-domain-containing protein [Neoantrodia serialis]
MQSQAARHRRSFSKSGMDQVICEGWVLKKRRKKMQGFARRYFKLQQSGWLSYSFEPGHPSRDQIFLPQAAISSTPGRRDIHVDAGTATFHIKCLTVEDFNKWMTASRKFLAPKDGQGAYSPSLGRRSTVKSLRTSQLGLGSLGKVGPLAEEMGNTIDELQTLVSAWHADTLKRRSGSIRSKGDKEKKDRGKEHGGHVLVGFLKKAAPLQQASTSRDSTQEEPSDASPSSSANVEKVQAVLDTLKHQHSALMRVLPGYPTLDTSHSPTAGTSLSATSEEDGDQTPTASTSLAQKLGRTSMISSNSGGSNSVWFDAPEPEGAEEFVLDSSPGDERENGILDEGVQPSSPVSQSDDVSSSDATTDADTDAESDSESEAAPETAPTSPAQSNEDRRIVRRTELPSGPVGDEGSLFSVLKKNVGKDLSQVAMPVSFNEPLTLLQKMAEEIECHDMLSQAAHTEDPVDRLSLVAAFAVSTYANTKYRTGRKGFNPMLAETFEEPRMRFIAEKVSHNPVILAFHAEGDGWELWATSSGKTKFWGKSLEIIPQGTTHLKLGDEHYEWKRPSSFMRNLMMGTKYLEHCGKLTIENTTSGGKCVLDFKEGGYWGPSNQVSGTVVSSNGKTQAHLEGKWDEQMARKLDSSHLRVLWRITPFPKNAPDLYGFTAFGITLNEITSDLEGRLPPTDSRLRTDVRALEEGDIDRAEEEKKRIEEMQRDRRKMGAECRPRWFKQQGDEWVYVGGYWEQRDRGWKDIQPLW